MMKVDSRQIGATTDGMKAALRVPRKTKLTSATSASEMPMVIQTSSIAWAVKTELSEPTTSSVPAGRLGRTCSSISRTPSEMARSFDWA